ncbi:BQ2448_2008 [Microbotryum intermedium]|uniref:BQ2448_2008 protein n=1 Tax=Microbotryum intermedium TaxID=269621 RepID=A0A238FCX1_9BASI|nr:BQ2448_2008 [Microbotryum intermedium]
MLTRRNGSGSGGGGGRQSLTKTASPAAAANHGGEVGRRNEPPVAAAIIHHLTRRRTNSVIRPPRRLDSPSPDRTTSMSNGASAAAGAQSRSSVATRAGAGAGAASAGAAEGPASTTSTTHRHGTRLASATSASASRSPLHIASSQTTTTTSPTSTTTTATITTISSSSSSSHSTPTPSSSASHAGPPRRAPTFPHNDSYVPNAATGHPRDFIPPELDFPPPAMAAKVRKQDADDRLLMAICDVLLSHQNRALCPKEIAEVMFARDWLKSAGTTPFAHISTCIRSHTRRAQIADPPYQPLLLPFELVGALSPHEVAAVGLVAEERPAVKRGTLWYLNEALFGSGLGAEDPFVRCRREAGLSTAGPATLRARGLVSLSTLQTEDDDGDDGGMGRGKRKRRASSAMLAALTTDIDSTSVSMNARPPMLLTGHRGATGHQSSLHRRNQTVAPLSSSAPAKTGLPKLRLRLTCLEEVENDSDGFTSDAARRRRASKKKSRRGTSVGASETSGGRFVSVESEVVDDNLAGQSSSEDDDVEDLMVARDLSRSPGKYSSASSSALLAQSLLAASTTSSTPLSSGGSTQDAVSPDSLQLPCVSPAGGASFRPSPRPHLSMSVPSPFSPFLSARSSEMVMEGDDNIGGPQRLVHDADRLDSADEDDFHEAMLRGDDFDFEWGSESYTSNIMLPPFSSKSRSREMSLSLPEGAFDLKDEIDDAASTPATTPRSPAGSEEPEPAPPSAASAAAASIDGLGKMGMEETLCGAYASKTDDYHSSQTIEIKVEDTENERAGSTDSLTSLVDESMSIEPETPVVAARTVDESALAVPLPSPLALDLPPMLALTPSVDYDFVGHDQEEHAAFAANSADEDNADDEDEHEDDELVTVKLEDGGSVTTDTGSSSASSQSSSTFPYFESLSRRMHALRNSPSSSGSSENGEMFCDLTPIVVSKSMLATGLPVPQQAPSPPETTDWGLQLDPDEFELDISHSTDFLGPEAVGLEELDLAWGGEDDEQGEFEADEHFKLRCEQRLKTRLMEKVASTPTFLTGCRPSTPRGRSHISKASTPTPAALRAALHADDDEDDSGSLPSRTSAKRETLRPSDVVADSEGSDDGL